MNTYEYVDPKTGQLTTKQAADVTSALQGTGSSGVRLVTNPVANTQQPVANTQSYVPPQPPDMTPDWAKQNNQIAGNQGFTSKFAYTPNETDTALNDANAFFKGQANTVVPTEQDAYQNQLRMYQAQIDAANKVYNDMLAKTRVENANRTGSAGARQARGGLLGSERGAAIDTQTTQFNLSEEQSVENQRLARIEEILGNARQGAAKEIADKQAAKRAGYDDYIKFIGATESRNKSKLSGLATQLLASGIDINTMTPAELSEIAKSYGVSKTDIMSAYKTAKTEQDKAELENQKLRGDIAKDGGVTLSEGQKYFTRDADGNLVEAASGGVKSTANMSSQETMDTAAAVMSGIIKIKDLSPSQRAVVAAELQRQGKGGVIKEQANAYAIQKKQVMNNEINTALNEINNISKTPIMAIAASKIPGTPEYQLAKRIETIKANIGFNELNDMRAASPTGGALGQVAVQELEALQNSQGSLDMGLPVAVLEQNIRNIQASLTRWAEAVNKDAMLGSSNENIREKDGVQYEKVEGGWRPVSLTNVGGDTNQASIENLKARIAKVETGGRENPYQVRSDKPTKRKDGRLDWAYGKYQVMGDNIPSWTKEALGKSMTIEQFRNSPEAQEAVATYQFNKYFKKYGNEADVASVWFTGQPLAVGKNRKDAFGTTGQQYVNKVMKV